MPKLSVITEESAPQCLAFEPGPSLMALLQTAWLPVRSGCHNSGACGLCRVRVIRGDAGQASLAETLHLDSGNLAAGERLACQIFPNADLEVEILAPARAFEPRPMHSLTRDDNPSPSMQRPCRPSPGADDRLGIAVDLGTTMLRLSLCDLGSGERLADCAGVNPQLSSGLDVLSRLQSAVESPDARARLSQSVVAAIGTGIWDMMMHTRVPLARIQRLSIVGNTAMLALLTSNRIEQQLRPQHWDQPGAALTYDADTWSLAWGLAPDTEIELVPPLGGFVGSDLLAAALAARLDANAAPALLIDFGTNSELALWDGEHLHVTAAAGGPAFEGSGISCGWPAERGAITRVRPGDEDRLAFEVIGGGEPRGLCGSGLVDLIALLLRRRQLSAIGGFASAIPARGFQLRDAAMTAPPIRSPLTLTKADVDSFQRAKAAIGAGIQALLDSAQLPAGSLRQLWIAGAFGAALDLENARSIGLLPALDDARCHFAEGAALLGCEQILLDRAAAAQGKRLRDRIRLINLAQYPAFETAFMAHLYLRPQTESAAAFAP
nr:ASKHA domain-containing protein [Thiorhodococcus minor]